VTHLKHIAFFKISIFFFAFFGFDRLFLALFFLTFFSAFFSAGKFKRNIT